MWSNKILFTAWWCYTGWVKRVILTFLSYYFTLFRITSHLSHITSPFWYYFHTFCRITSSFWYYFHTFCRITSPLWYYFHTFSRITSPLWYYSHTLSHVTSPFHPDIVDSSKPRFTLGWIQNVWYKTYQQLGYREHKHRVKIFPCVWIFAYFNAPKNYLVMSIFYFLD